MSPEPGSKRVILAALRQEATPIRRAQLPQGCVCITCGIGPRRAALAARQHATGAALLVSAGCCGGLAPALPQGQFVIPEQVLLLGPAGSPTQTFATSARWRAAACQAADGLGLPWTAQPLATSSKALFSATSKQACHQATGAAGVDMESAAIAEVAAELGIPFFALRVVLDTAAEALPGGPSRPDGQVQPKTLAAAALKAPAAALSMASLLWRLGRICQPLAQVLTLALQHGPADDHVDPRAARL